jgi:hypothetical protein
MIDIDWRACFYCRVPILKGEMDHAPIPQRYGGEDVVPACIRCHDLKDRLPARRWPVDLQMQALEECGRLGRIYLAKAFAAELDREAHEALLLEETA